MTRQHGAFVYTGSGKKQATDADPAQIECKQLACGIQWCLSRNNHKQEKCKDHVAAWKECCDKVHARVAQKAQEEVAMALKAKAG